MASATVIEPTEAPAVSGNPERGSAYRCECGHTLRVFGGGRHRVYFEPGNTRLEDPVMNRACPACGHSLPGRNRP